MAVLKMLTFRGEIPLSPGHLLPEDAAQFAHNCDFAHGELRGRRDNATVDTMPPVGGVSIVSVYTEDGQYFFAWPWETDVVKSMVVDDIFHRIFYTGQPDAPIIKVARTFRNDYGVLTRVIGSNTLLGGNYKPPEASNEIIFGGNSLGPDSWILGIPVPMAQNKTIDDVPVASVGEKRAWPGVPNMKLRVTYFLEDPAGKIVYQFDVSNTESAYVPANPSNVYPQVAYTNDTSQRGNKVQDMLWPLFGFQTPAPFKFYFMQPPLFWPQAIGRTVTIKNEAAAAVSFDYTIVVAAPAATTEQA